MGVNWLCGTVAKSDRNVATKYRASQPNSSIQVAKYTGSSRIPIFTYTLNGGSAMALTAGEPAWGWAVGENLVKWLYSRTWPQSRLSERKAERNKRRSLFVYISLIWAS